MFIRRVVVAVPTPVDETHWVAALNYHPQVILVGRRIDGGMGAHVAGQAVKTLYERPAPDTAK